MNSNAKITIKTAMYILGVSERTAQRYIRTCRDALSKQKQHILSIKEFCSYYDIEL